MADRELQDWLRYWAAEPWGATRDNMHAGLIAAAVFAPHVRRGKKAPTFKDFMLKDAATAQDERRRGTAAVLASLKARAKRKPKT